MQLLLILATLIIHKEVKSFIGKLQAPRPFSQPWTAPELQPQVVFGKLSPVLTRSALLPTLP